MPAPGQMPAGTFMREIQDRGKLIAATSPDQLLFGYVNPLDGQIEGLDVDLLTAVAAAIFGGDGTSHIQILTVTLAQRIPKILDGSVDIVADTMTINCARRQQVDFSTEYYDAGQKVLVPRNSTAQSISDLAGKHVCAAAGSTSIDNLAQFKGVIPFAVPDQSDCLVQFQEGTVDAISTDDAVLAGLVKQDPFAKVVGPRFTDEPYGMAISLKHPEFTAFVNGVLDQMRANGTLQAVYTHWLGPVFNPLPAIPAARYKG
jgi:polar amino acid transport system substrate-binding protein